MSQIRRQHKHEESKCKRELNAENLIEVGHKKTICYILLR